jgi:serine phosphatase RsbU (regulator of sigma subunit)
MHSGIVHTTDFHHEFAAETSRLFRRRFLWFLGTVAAVYLVSILFTAVPFVLDAVGLIPGQGFDAAVQRFLGKVRGGTAGVVLVLCLTVIDLGVFAWCFARINRGTTDLARLQRFSFWFLVYRGMMDILTLWMLNHVGFPWLLGFYHVLACIFLPWTPMQSVRPLMAVLVVNAVMVLLFSTMGATGKALTIVLSMFVVAPGAGIAWFKTNRRTDDFKMRFLQSRYGQMRRELIDARRLHESLFPSPLTQGPLRLDYRYEPMRQIGGDYLYARFSPVLDGRPAAFNLLLLDVTGHGIAAALTVNRLYGEVERLYAENPHARPGEVLTALNRYVHLTLAGHSVFATALCVRFDPGCDELEYASGGHPPAFLLAVDGTIHQLESTAFVLGAASTADFDADPRTVRFGPGDRIVAYTDGAIEARSPQGRMLGVQGLQRMLAGAVQQGVPEIASAVLTYVERHRAAPPEDDTLVVEIVRDVGGVQADGRMYSRSPDAASPLQPQSV